MTLTLKIANQSFHMRYWPMAWCCITITKFGYKRFSSWEDIQMIIHWNFESLLWPWTEPQENNLIFSKDNPAYAIKPSLVTKRISSTEDTVEGDTWPYKVFSDLDNKDSKAFFSLQLMMMHHYTKFSDKRFSSSEDIDLTNIHQHSEVSPWPWLWTQWFIFFA